MKQLAVIITLATITLVIASGHFTHHKQRSYHLTNLQKLQCKSDHQQIDRIYTFDNWSAVHKYDAAQLVYDDLKANHCP